MALLLLLVFLLREMFIGSMARKYYLLYLKSAGLDEDALLIHKKKTVFHIGANWRQVFSNRGLNSHSFPLSQIIDSQISHELKKSIKKLVRCEEDCREVVFIKKSEYTILSQYIPTLKIHALLLTDTTEQEYIKQLKHWALVAQRLAHGIKNPLTTVKLNAEELKFQLRKRYKIDNEEIDSFIDSIIGQVNRLKKMSDGFMRFVAFEHPKWEVVDLNEELKERAGELKASITGKIRIDFELAENLPLVKIDREQFFHALSAIFYNAVESMDGDGRVVISTSRTNLIIDEKHLPSEIDYVLLQIRDTGCGIPAEFLDKVIQPFFSRNKKEGTGLGLSIVQKIVEMHGGKLEIYSEVSEGTTVSIWLPATDE